MGDGSCLRCAFDSQAQTLCPGVTPTSRAAGRPLPKRGHRGQKGGEGQWAGGGPWVRRGGGWRTTVTVSIHQEAQG